MDKACVSCGAGPTLLDDNGQCAWCAAGGYTEDYYLENIKDNDSK